MGFSRFWGGRESRLPAREVVKLLFNSMADTYKIQDTIYKIQDTGYMQDTGYRNKRIQDVGYKHILHSLVALGGRIYIYIYIYIYTLSLPILMWVGGVRFFCCT